MKLNPRIILKSGNLRDLQERLFPEKTITLPKQKNMHYYCYYMHYYSIAVVCIIKICLLLIWFCKIKYQYLNYLFSGHKINYLSYIYDKCDTKGQGEKTYIWENGNSMSCRQKKKKVVFLIILIFIIHSFMI